jgi:hypothetical protein
VARYTLVEAGLRDKVKVLMGRVWCRWISPMPAHLA